MNLLSLKHWAGSHWHNIPGWRTNRKIVVFESDDWGSIRIPSLESYNKLLKAGLKVDRSPFLRFDALESEEDLTALFETLQKFKDSNGNHPIFTANTIVANPDFEKIKEANFEEYFYEPFNMTYYKYPKHQKCLEILKQGITTKLFHPQLHGREHLNVKFWLDSLYRKEYETLIAFNEKTFALDELIVDKLKYSFLPAFDYVGNESPKVFINIIKEAQRLFENIFDYSSKSFIAPNYVWDENVEKILYNNSVKYIQSSRGQLLPLANHKHRKYKRHYLGEQNRLSQIYLVRNTYFEPTSNLKKDTLSECLKQIKTSFLWNKPAIIGTHRLNYIGYIHQKNRTRNLNLLNTLLKKILTTWPDVEFMASDEIGDLLIN